MSKKREKGINFRLNFKKHRIKLLVLIIISILIGVGALEYYEFQREQEAINIFRSYFCYNNDSCMHEMHPEVIGSIKIQTLPTEGAFSHKNVILNYEIEKDYFSISEPAGPSCNWAPPTTSNNTNCQGWVEIIFTSPQSYSDKYQHLASTWSISAGEVYHVYLPIDSLGIGSQVYVYLITPMPFQSHSLPTTIHVASAWDFKVCRHIG